VATPGADSRGQLILLSAVVIAIILLGIVAVLNGGIYAQNAGERSALSASSGATGAANTLRTDAPDLLTASASATLGDGVFVARQNLVRNVSQYDGYLSRAVASERPASVDVTLLNTTNGSGGYLVDDNTSSAPPDGSLTQNANQIGRFNLRVRNLRGPFRVEVGGWNVTLSNAGSGTVHVATSGGIHCTVHDAGNGVGVNLSAGLVEAAPNTCDFPPPSASSVTFANPDDSTGTFTLATDGQVENPTLTGTTTRKFPNLTSARFRVEYSSVHASYNTTLTVRPRTSGPTSVRSPPRSEFVYAVKHNGTNWLYSMNRYGVPTNLSEPNVTAVGPKQVDFDGSGGLDVPFVNASGTLFLADQHGARKLASGASTDSPLAVGRWRGLTSVYYVNQPSGELYRATPGLNPTPVRADGGPVSANVALGIANVSGTGTPALVYRTGSSIKYIENNATYSLGTASSGGAPRSFNGSVGVPVVTSGGAIKVDSKSGSLWTASGASPVNAPLAAIDWTRNGTTDVVYVDGGGKLAYVNSTGGTGVELKTVNGKTVPVNASVGVA